MLYDKSGVALAGIASDDGPRTMFGNAYKSLLSGVPEPAVPYTSIDYDQWPIAENGWLALFMPIPT